MFRRPLKGGFGKTVHLIGAVGAWVAFAVSGGRAVANLRAPRSEFANPSSAVHPVNHPSPLRVVHEDLIFRCHGGSSEVSATYAIEADASLSTELAFVLPVETAVVAMIGSATVRPAVTRLNAPPSGFAERLDLRREYEVPTRKPLPPLYQAVTRALFVPGQTRLSFSYRQPLGALEFGHSYFHDGTMIPRLLYVLWPLREWKHAPGFTIALRIEMDRNPPGWWKRTFGHPADISCDQLQGHQAQVGQQLVYTTTLTDDFPDYLRCFVGP